MRSISNLPNCSPIYKSQPGGRIPQKPWARELQPSLTGSISWYTVQQTLTPLAASNTITLQRVPTLSRPRWNCPCSQPTASLCHSPTTKHQASSSKRESWHRTRSYPSRSTNWTMRKNSNRYWRKWRSSESPSTRWSRVSLSEIRAQMERWRIELLIRWNGSQERVLDRILESRTRSRRLVLSKWWRSSSKFTKSNNWEWCMKLNYSKPNLPRQMISSDANC